MATRGELKKALSDWLGWLKKTGQAVVPRGTPVQLPKELCLALIGVRRSGKSYLSVQLSLLQQAEKTFYFNFEDPLFFPGVTVDILDQLLSVYEELIGSPPTLVILDEVQNVQGWERWVRKQVDISKCQLIVTGSSSQLLSSEIATAISGRVIEHTVWPLSFKESLAFKNIQPDGEGGWIRALEHYLKWGGFPRAVLMEDAADRIFLLKQYLSDIVLRDVTARHNIKNQHALNQIVSYYLTGISNLHSYNSVRKAFGLSIELVTNITHYLETAFLVFQVSRYHPNLKVQARDPKKIYMIDNGLRTVSLSSDRTDLGFLAENVVYLELRRRGLQIFYFKEKQEVDFVITELGRPVDAIQVCYSDLSNSTTYQREVGALVECLEALQLPSGKILTLNLRDTKQVEGKTVDFIPLHEWLL